jgi:hypothetical protein
MCRLAAVATQPVMEGDREGHFAVPRAPACLSQVARRFLDRRFQVVEPIKHEEVVEGGCDRDLLVVLRGQR